MKLAAGKEMESPFMPTKVIIDGVNFTIHPFKAIEALRIKTVLLKKLAPAVGHLIGGIETFEDMSKLQDINLNGDMFAKSLESLFADMDENEMVKLILRLITNVVAEVKTDEGIQAMQLNTEQGFNAVFQGRIFVVYTLIYHVMKVNYPDFFDRVEGIGKSLKTVLDKSQSKRGKGNSKQ